MSYSGSGSITLASVFDGTDANGYSLETTKFEIYRNKSKNNGKTIITFDPEEIVCKAYHTTLNGKGSYTISAAGDGRNFNIRVVSNVAGKQTQKFINLLDLVNYTQEIYSCEKNTFILKINELLDYISKNKLTNTALQQLENILLNEEPYFIFELYDPQVGAQQFLKDCLAVQITHTIPDELAKFEVSARAINTAVGNSLMQFTEDGLQIINGNFKISKTVDDGEGNIKIEDPLTFDGNNLTVTGTIYAKNGEFSGTIEAGSGHIGGFIIGEKSLTSADETKSLILNSDGSVIANNISLGQKATIRNYIKLGDEDNFAYIYNPEYARTLPGAIPYFLWMNNSNYLTSEGLLCLGGVIIDGERSTIEAQNGQFTVSPEIARFTNVEVAGKINASVFAVNQTQLLGGSVLFKPSFRIKDVLKETIQEEKEGEVEDVLCLKIIFNDPAASSFMSKGIYILLIDDTGKSLLQKPADIKEVKSNEEEVDFYIYILYPDSFPKSSEEFEKFKKTIYNCIVLGETGSLNIGINANLTSTNYMLGQGLTMSTFNPENNTDSFTTEVNLFLGNLANINSKPGLKDVKGYGLYADNVFLNGSLTTTIDSTKPNSYAGINTLSDISFNKDPNGVDTSSIVFWAGAENLTDTIQNAPFQVSAKGSLYAQQGIFRDSLFVGASLYSTDIYTARIHGSGKSEEGNKYGLSFYDVDNSIGFFKGDIDNNNEPSLLYGIGEQGLFNIQRNQKYYFVQVNNDNNKTIDIKANTINAISNTNNNTSSISQVLQLKDYSIFATTNEEGAEPITEINLATIDENNRATIGFYTRKNNCFQIGEDYVQSNAPRTLLVYMRIIV